jgi:hypothetical protein
MVTCSRGHVTETKFQNEKFCLLFDIGSMALLDGYLKEACSTYASSIEQFYEFYVKFVAIRQGVKATDFYSYWKSLSKQSERQLGCLLFISAY